jgi:hypothetical protein
VGLDFLEVGHVVELGVENGAVVFARGEEDRGFSAKEQVVGIIGVQGDWLGGFRAGGLN